MKKIYLILLMLILIIPGIKSQSTVKSKYLKPVNYQKRVTTVISGKNRNYYSLSDKETSVINIKGPGKIRILSRGRFQPNQDNSEIRYEVVYSVDGAAEEKTRFSGIKRSTKATYLKGTLGVPGQLKDFEIELGRGYHTVSFKMAEDIIPVAARYQYTPTKAKKIEWIAFSPLRPNEPVNLISRESTVGYYRFSSEKSLKVQINGPTELRVLTRIENHYQMKGRILYRVQVKENGVVKNTYQLSSRRSEVAVYEDDKELIPGKACEFVINVPKGKHIYEILPLDRDKSTILGRLLIPEKDVKLVE